MKWNKIQEWKTQNTEREEKENKVSGSHISQGKLINWAELHLMHYHLHPWTKSIECHHLLVTISFSFPNKHKYPRPNQYKHPQKQYKNKHKQHQHTAYNMVVLTQTDQNRPLTGKLNEQDKKWRWKAGIDERNAYYCYARSWSHRWFLKWCIEGCGKEKFK